MNPGLNDLRREDAEDEALRAQRLLAGHESLSEEVHLGWLAWHACLTGDCPHSDVKECDSALANEIRQLADEQARRRADYVACLPQHDLDALHRTSLLMRAQVIGNQV